MFNHIIAQQSADLELANVSVNRELEINKLKVLVNYVYQAFKFSTTNIFDLYIDLLFAATNRSNESDPKLNRDCIRQIINDCFKFTLKCALKNQPADFEVENSFTKRSLESVLDSLEVIFYWI